MTWKKLQDIKKELDKSIQSKSIIKLPVSDNLVNDIRESLELIEGHPNQEKMIKELIDIYERFIRASIIIRNDCWDSFKHSLGNDHNLSNKYDVKVVYKNLSVMVEASKLLYDNELCKIVIDSSKSELLNEFVSIQEVQKKMEETLEKMEQQQNEAGKTGLEELENKTKKEFSKYIENSTIDVVSVRKYTNTNYLYTQIKLKDDNKSTDIKISEFLNNDFCKENSIVGFLIFNNNKEKIIKGHVCEGIRYYDLGNTAQYGIKFNWYVDEKECSITLGANSDGSIRIIGDRPTDTDLEKNKDVKIKVGNDYLSLAKAVKTCKQKRNEAPSEHFRPVQMPVQCFPTFQEISNCSHNT